MVVERASGTVTLPVTPALVEQDDTCGGKQRIGVLGIQASRQASDWKTQHFGLLELAKVGVSETWYVVERTLRLYREARERPGIGRPTLRPIWTAQVSGLVATNSGLLGLINLAAILSVSIGLIGICSRFRCSMAAI